MTSGTRDIKSSNSLDILGINEAEEHAYEWLLAHVKSTAAEMAEALSLTPGKTQHLLDALENKGLVTHSPERPRRYIPASPDIALEAFAVRRQEELHRARTSIQRLQELSDTAHPKEQGEHMVELITSKEAERQVVAQIEQSTMHESSIFVRMPLRVSTFDDSSKQEHDRIKEGKNRGVTYRAVIDTGFFDIEGAAARIRRDIDSGGEPRIYSNLPFKMVLSDRRIALIPMNLDDPDSPSLLIRSSALLDALYVLFEMFWERATPIAIKKDRVIEIGKPDSEFPEGVEDLITLMAAGMNDKYIAAELDLSIRTLHRRVADIMKDMDARTRFQLGWMMALRLAGIDFSRDVAHIKS